MTNLINAICQECGIQFEYDLKPGFPRKYCIPCSEAKKASFAAQQGGQVTTPQPQYPPETVVQKIGAAQEAPKMKAPTGEFQSLVYSKTLSANSFEVGKSGDRFKLYFETVEDLQAKINELKDAGFMQEEVIPF